MFTIMEPVVKTEDSKEYPLLSACRACLKPGDISLFEANISENFIEFGGIKITMYDSLPKYLCNHCNLLLEAAILFRENVMNTDETLREYFCNNEWFFENEEHGHKLTNKFCAGSSPEYLTYETSDKIDVNYKNDDSLSNDSISCTKSEKEYLVIKYETDKESDLIMNNKITANMSDEEQKEVVETDWFTCEMCHLEFKSVDELENHIELEHKINPTDKMNCAVCGSVISRAYYKVHLKLHREKFKQKKSKHTKVKCEICNKSLNSSYYPFHLKMHGSDTDKAARKRQCKICRKSFVMHYYNDHMKRVHKVTPNGDKLKETSYYQKQKHIQCVVCDKYISEHKYKKHLANHGPPTRKYICDHCGKEFKYRSGFIVHLLTHGSTLKHKCKFCDYQAVHVGLLKVHVRIHTKDYNYKCTQCPARFTTKSNLSQHIQRHNGPGHIKCYGCDRMFHRKRNMEEHHKTIHLKIRDVNCDICGKGFSHRDGMLSHQLKVHNRDRLPKQITAAYLKIKEKAIKDK